MFHRMAPQFVLGNHWVTVEQVFFRPRDGRHRIARFRLIWLEQRPLLQRRERCYFSFGDLACPKTADRSACGTFLSFRARFF